MANEKQFVRDLKEKEPVASTFLVTEKVILKDRNGKPYMSLNLSDATGALNARLWEQVEDCSRQFDSGDFVFVKGHVQVYQNRRQIVVHELRKADSSTLNLKDFTSRISEDPQAMLTKLESLVTTMENPWIRELVQYSLGDAELRPRLLRAPAAKTIHHAHMGGLLEHILSICHIMNFMAEHYSYLNRDLLLFGAIFHDLGKVWELSIEDGIKYTDRGRLVGHMALACEWVDLYAERKTGFPPELKDVLKHIILSHHGRLEYGSPKEPAFPEAALVAMVDELDSKLTTMVEFMRNELEESSRWTRLSSHFDRYFLMDFLREKVRR